MSILCPEGETIRITFNMQLPKVSMVRNVLLLKGIGHKVSLTEDLNENFTRGKLL